MSKLRIATWNLERPTENGHLRNVRRIKKIREIDADLWVLTETHAAITLDGYTSLASQSLPGYHANGESFATILSRWPIRRAVSTLDPYLRVS